MAYLTTAGIEGALRYLASGYPTLCQLITMPEHSVEGRTIRAVKIGKGGGANRRGVLYIGGVHARELVNPDMLVSLGFQMCQSYTQGTDIVLGGRTYQASTVKLIMDAMDVYLLPLVNPDGRTWVQSPAGYAMWRKNRRVNPGASCMGVDVNRNYDFLFSSGIGTSTDACSDVFRGPSAFSEPETRNVRWMLDSFPNIRGFIDVHSYSELVLLPWGDDSTQTSDPGQNFANPAYNGLRGNPGDTVYAEYMQPDDNTWFFNAGNAVRDAIAAVRGRNYLVEHSVGLYPTSGTSDDYVYARHLVDTGKTKVYALTIETAREFQPAAAEAAQVIKEGCSALLQFSTQVLCLADSLAADSAVELDMTALRHLRDHTLAGSVVGRRYVSQLAQHTPAMAQLLAGDPELRNQCVEILRDLRPALSADGGTAVPEEVIKRIDKLAANLSRRKDADPDLAAALDGLRADLEAFRGRPIAEGLHELDRKVALPGRVATMSGRRAR
ncbi:hypothetical protein Lfu02_62250 [Longispora fulva]|uniref:Zinc carboxypeptidase n=1 Tax=Longispora fulva TaxID=619741 RepID=A0A8J7G7R9_9ACTN|nr:M14 family zinc carboxypeptidase [Longispora fulva]MBG6134645.1 murein tripeptide amidase MpaA [Longispora fulva]GIG61853.1 hypothetical protein Lfu02_62250 [Longispora fulva]